MTSYFLKPRSFPRFSHFIWIALCVIGLRVTYYTLSDGFSICKIENTFPVTSEWQLKTPSTREKNLLGAICSKPFHYLAKGSQAYAFESEDKKYVLKLFKCYHLTPVTWLEKMPLPTQISEWRNQSLNKRTKKINDTLNSYKIASTRLREECGLISMAILPTSEFHQKVTLIDKLGRSHEIDLGRYGFVLQQKADLIYPKMSQWIATGQLDDAKKAIDSIVRLIVQRSKKGIQDSDPDLHKNSGLIGTTAIFIDIGSLHANPAAAKSEVYMQDLRKISNKFHEWLKKQSPELAVYLEQQIEKAS